MLCPATQAKVETVRNQLEHLEHTGNPQYAYYAIQYLMWITEVESNNWNPETERQNDALASRKQEDR